MTTELERRTQDLADEYMEANPGVPRQEAKRRVMPRAQMQLAREQIEAAWQRFARAMQPSWERAAESARRSLSGDP